MIPLQLSVPAWQALTAGAHAVDAEVELVVGVERSHVLHSSSTSRAIYDVTWHRVADVAACCFNADTAPECTIDTGSCQSICVSPTCTPISHPGF